MHIYLAVKVFEDNNWWDAQHMLGAYLTEDAALAALQADEYDDAGPLMWADDDYAGDPASRGVVDSDEEYGVPWRYVVRVELDADAAVNGEPNAWPIVHGDTHRASALSSLLRREEALSDLRQREWHWYNQPPYGDGNATP